MERIILAFLEKSENCSHDFTVPCVHTGVDRGKGTGSDIYRVPSGIVIFSLLGRPSKEYIYIFKKIFFCKN